MRKQWPRSVVHFLGWAILAVWAFSAVVRMAILQSDKLGTALLVGLTVVILSFVAWAVVQTTRAGKQPPDEEQRAALHRIWNPIFSVISAGFATGCIAGLIAVIELNDTFSAAAFDRAAGGHPWLFWAVVGAGVVIGVGGHIGAIKQSTEVADSKLTADAGAPAR